MWSKVLLATGVMVTVCGGIVFIILIKKHKRYGTDSLYIVAISEAVVCSFIGLLLTTVGLLAFDGTSRTLSIPECSIGMIISRTAAFVIPFVNSFVSMLLTATECWMKVQEKAGSLTLQKFPFMKKSKRLAGIVATQWMIPITLMTIFYLLMKDTQLPMTFKSVQLNHTCNEFEMAPIVIDEECPSNLKNQLKIQKANNITTSIVQQIYELLKGIEFRHSDNIDLHLPSYSQNEEGWEILNNKFIRIQEKSDGMEPISMKKPSHDEADLEMSACTQHCTLNSRAAKLYLTGVIIIVYIISLIGTVLLYFRTKASMTFISRSPETIPQELKDFPDKCLKRYMKNAMTVTIFMWSPIFIARLLSKWFCQSTPEWVLKLLFILGQMSIVLRGAMNIKLQKPLGTQGRNAVHPSEPSPKDQEPTGQQSQQLA